MTHSVKHYENIRKTTLFQSVCDLNTDLEKEEDKNRKMGGLAEATQQRRVVLIFS